MNQIMNAAARSYDKSAWPKGEWDNEPDKLNWIDEATGLDCMILRNPRGALCGYVGVKENHPLFEVDHCAINNLDVHDGLSYSAFCDGAICHPTEDHKDLTWWLGFACMDVDDFQPGLEKENPFLAQLNAENFDVKYRNIEYVKSECEKLAAQLSAITD